MEQRSSISIKTRSNWLVDAVLFTSGLTAALSGIYFLYLPVGGYQGGRNPYYGLTVLFNRNTWSDLHTWAGVIMIGILLVHLPLHWDWVVNMSRRMYRGLFHGGSNLNARSRFNFLINLLVGTSFVLTALSGVYLLFVSGGARFQDPNVLFSRTTWDLIHTWSGVVLITAALVHFAIHWGWVVKVTRKILGVSGTGMRETAIALDSQIVELRTD